MTCLLDDLPVSRCGVLMAVVVIAGRETLNFRDEYGFWGDDDDRSSVKGKKEWEEVDQDSRRGYRVHKQCLLFTVSDLEWHVDARDGPFIDEKGDDLYLKEVFEKSWLQQLFVWYHQPSLPSLPRTKLLDVYSEIGVSNFCLKSAQSRTFLQLTVQTGRANPGNDVCGENLSKVIIYLGNL
nr:uncharacterized protein LOC109170777 [Ipomoea batatas]